MKQSEAYDHEDKICRDKASNFRGKARIMLEVLQFTSESMKEIDEKNVERLKCIFEEGGCLREAPERHVPAIIRSADLAAAVKFTASPDVSLEKLLNNPKELPPLLKFPPNVHIECLSGKHRIQAAKESRVLKPSEKWWIVDLYLEGTSHLQSMDYMLSPILLGLSQDSKRELSEEYSNSQNFSDGIIYRRIMEYDSLGNTFAAFQCWARLTKSKRCILRRFFKHKTLNSAFNRLLPIYGLWIDPEKGFCIGTLHYIMGMKIEEVGVSKKVSFVHALTIQ